MNDEELFMFNKRMNELAIEDKILEMGNKIHTEKINKLKMEIENYTEKIEELEMENNENNNEIINKLQMAVITNSDKINKMNTDKIAELQLFINKSLLLKRNCLYNYLKNK